MCFSNILEKFTAKQANIMDNFAEVMAENQSKNMNTISTEIGKQLNSFNENLSVYRANRSSEVATISVNPNKKSTGTATTSVNPVRDTASANSNGEENRNSETNWVKRTGEPIGSDLNKIISNVIRTPINKENLLKNWKATPDLKI